MVSANHEDGIRNVILCQRNGVALICHTSLCSDHWSAKAACFGTENHAIGGLTQADAIAKAVIHNVKGAGLRANGEAHDDCSRSQSCFPKKRPDCWINSTR